MAIDEPAAHDEEKDDDGRVNVSISYMINLIESVQRVVNHGILNFSCSKAANVILSIAMN